MEDDAAIIRRSLERPEVFAELFERHFDRVLAFARGRAGAVAGEEIAAQAFLVAFERRDRFDPSYASARPVAGSMPSVATVRAMVLMWPA